MDSPISQASDFLAESSEVITFLGMDLGRSFGRPCLDPQHAGIISTAACAILTDPRAVFVARVFRTQLKLISFLADLCPVFAINEHLLKEQQKQEERRCKEDGYGGYGYEWVPECAVLEQQKGFQRVADIALCDSCFSFDDDGDSTLDQRLEKIFGQLAQHPSVYFLLAVAIFKSGDRMEEAYKLFGLASKGPLLGPTCDVLRALTKFWAGDCGAFDVLKLSREEMPIEARELINSKVLAELHRALVSARAVPPRSAKSVPNELMANLHAAIALLSLNLPDGSTSAVEHFELPCTCLKDRPLDAMNMPRHCPTPLLLRRASYSLNLNLDIPGEMALEQVRELVDMLDEQWGSCSMKPQDIALWREGLPVAFNSQLGVWDSAAPKLASMGQGSESLGAHWRDLDSVLPTCWLVRDASDAQLSSTSATEGRMCCAVCGSTERQMRCGKCKVLRYCSAECQRADWSTLHKKVCPMLRP
eukprot:gene16001-22140_t